MGLAASQARYLELTARKTNVEFQGQQINQQRLELANESAGLFTQLMGLEVPTAPSSSDYTTTENTFNDGANDCTISGVRNISGDPNYNAEVTYYYTQSVYTGIGKTRTDLGVDSTSGTYWLTDASTGTPKTKLTHCSTSDTGYDDDLAAIQQIIDDTGSTAVGANFANAYTTSLTNYYKYKATDGTTYYYCNTDLNNRESGAASSITGFYAADIDKKIYTTCDAYLEKTDSGRYSSILLEDYTSPFEIKTTTTTDTNAYNDAMNEYEYQQTRYNQEVTSINAKTSVIQNQDKVLELQLAQLDTEQQALQTELDSVKKVIDKNIDQTFKTFQ